MPNMDWFRGNAAQHGNLVYFMNQNWTDPIAQDGPWGNVSKGYCVGLAVRWIRLAYAGRDYVGEPGYNIGGQSAHWFNGTDYQAVIYQNKCGVHYKAVKPDARTEAQYALGLGQMFLASDLVESAEIKATGTRLYRILKQSYGCYFVILRGPKSAHAIAMRHERPASGKGPGILHIFDANYGHFAWPIAASSWAQIMDSYLYFTGYGEKYVSRYVIGRATPPIY